jgi:hypothetical protein
MARQKADEGVIKSITPERTHHQVKLDNGNIYETSNKFDQDIEDPQFRGSTVRVLLDEDQRIWDISVM